MKTTKISTDAVTGATLNVITCPLTQTTPEDRKEAKNGHQMVGGSNRSVNQSWQRSKVWYATLAVGLG